MQFKIDENLPLELADKLREAEFDASTVYVEQLVGTSDTALIEQCRLEGRVLVSLDGDFADIRAYPPENYPGIVVLRLKRQDKNYVLTVFDRLLKLFETEEVQGKLWVVEEDRIRIRG